MSSFLIKLEREKMTPDDLEIVLYRLAVSKTDLATIVGVTPRQVNSWCRGVHPIPRSVAILLAALDNQKLSIEWVVDFVEAEIKKEI